MVILSGSSHTTLSQDIATAFGQKLVERQIRHFPNGELEVRITGLVEGDEVVIVGTLGQPIHQHLMEFFLLVDAALRRGAKKVVAVVPWLAYSRQDQAGPGEALSSQVLARLLAASGAAAIYTLDLHNPAIKKFFDIPLIDIDLSEVFADKLQTEADERTMIVAPDAGSTERSRALAALLGVPAIALAKKRDRRTGRMTFEPPPRDVAGKKCVIIDDMVDTGGTMIGAARVLANRGAAAVIGCATHGVLSRGFKPLEGAAFDRIYVSDSLPLPEPLPGWVTVVPVASAIAAVLQDGIEVKV